MIAHAHATESTLSLDPRLAGALLTPEEFDLAEIADDGYLYELVHGVLVVAPIPDEAEADPNEELGHLLRQYQQHHPAGQALDKTLAERNIRTGSGRRRADRVIWAGLGRLPDPLVDPPTIAVEFVSPQLRDRRRDYEDKRREYAEAGVREYWIVDRFRRTLTVFAAHVGPGGELHVTEKETYLSPCLPGFEFPLARLLAVADAWK